MTTAADTKEAREKRRVKRVNDPREGKFWEKWFTNPDVLWIAPEKQRTVTINAGRTVEWFKKDYPGKDSVVLTKKIYDETLPHNMTGKIIATTGVSGKDGVVRAKPIGTYYELFESGGYRQWVNPVDYGGQKPKYNRTKNKRSKWKKPARHVKK